MSERAAYSRVYASIIDDERFANVYDDDRALAAWLRLLLVADQAWPASAHLPITTNRKAVAILVSAGLVELQSGGRYRIHGLDSEREKRAAEQRNGGVVRAETGQRGPNGRYVRQPAVEPPVDPAVVTSGGDQRNQLIRDETRQDETRRDEQGARDPLDGPLAYYEVTTRYPSLHSELHAWTTALAEGYGADVFQRALATEFTASRRLNDLLSRTEARLAMEADRNRKANPVKFDRAAWIEQKRAEQAARYDAEGGAA